MHPSHTPPQGGRGRRHRASRVSTGLENTLKHHSGLLCEIHFLLLLLWSASSSMVVGGFPVKATPEGTSVCVSAHSVDLVTHSLLVSNDGHSPPTGSVRSKDQSDFYQSAEEAGSPLPPDWPTDWLTGFLTHVFQCLHVCVCVCVGRS